MSAIAASANFNVRDPAGRCAAVDPPLCAAASAEADPAAAVATCVADIGGACEPDDPGAAPWDAVCGPEIGTRLELESRSKRFRSARISDACW